MGNCGSCMSDEQGDEGARYQQVNADTVSATAADAMVGRKRVAVLPFLPKTSDKIDKRLKNGDEVFLQRILDGGNFSHNVVSVGDDMSLDVRTEESGRLNPMEGLDEAKCSFMIETDDSDLKVRDGSTVRFKLTSDYQYMAVNEKLAVKFIEVGAECEADATFQLFKERRPANLKHNDVIYLLNKEHLNYVDVGPANGKVYCRRWERTNIQAFKVSKAEVLKSGIKEELLALQFEAFDLDGNGNITKAEVEFMLDRVAGDDLGDVDKIMSNCDPDLSGGISFEEFSEHFAGLEGWTEAKLQHAQALGNVAQRVSDTIFEEEAMIEVLGTCVSSSMMPQVKALYATTFKESLDDLIDNMGDNTGEEDGWFFSNSWKMTMKALLTDEVSLWAKALIDSVKGLGTDENSLMALVCTLPEKIHDDICIKFEEDYGKSLVAAIEEETSFNFKKVLVLQAMKPHEAQAKALNGAMVGLGTDETQLIRILCMCDLEERQLIKKAYADMYERDLLSDVESETSGDFKKALQGIIMAKEEEFDLEADCAALKEAMDGWGTDETTLITKICSKSARQMELLNEKFEELYSKRLLFRVKDETSGYFRDVLEACLRHPMRQLAESVRYCVKGWGTDDTGLITCLVHLPEFKRKQLITEYKAQFERNIIDDITNDTSGDYRQALLALVNPPPVTWARALKGAMKGLGTADELLINFMVIGKDHMDEVRRHFSEANGGQYLADWIDGDCSGDYKKMLMAIADRSSEDDASDFIMPIYWAQRLYDSFHDVDHLIDILVSLPAIAVRKGTKIFEQVYQGRTLMDCLSMKTDEKKGSFFFRSDNWKNALRGLLDMPVERRCRTLSDAMVGWGTDEYTLTAVVCTIPENLTKDVHAMYQKMFNRSLVEHIESETSFNYRQALVMQSLDKPMSRAKALNGAMAGFGTDENQLIRIIVGATMKEREAIMCAYQSMYDQDLIAHIESETSGYFAKAMVSILRYRFPTPEGDMDYEADCNTLKEACEGSDTGDDHLISVLSCKTPQQLEKLQAKWVELFGEEPTLAGRIEAETSGFFESADFRETLLGLLRSPGEQLAVSVQYCIEGWGTCDTGLCTLLSHLSERQRTELRDNYKKLTGTDLIDAIKGDTSGDYANCLCAMVRPFPEVWAEALVGAMKGLGTSDNLLINWMILGKERMDEVREAFEIQTGGPLVEWIEGDCSADYKDTLVALAKRKVTKFPGSEVGLTIAPPLTPEVAIEKFRLVFMNLCRIKAKNPEDNLIPSEEHQQDMGTVFAYFGSRSSVAPNLDRNGVWDLTSAIGFAPADQEEDLSATFWEWDYDGIGEISWNNFVQEMTTRVNDPNHWESPTGGLNI